MDIDTAKENEFCAVSCSRSFCTCIGKCGFRLWQICYANDFLLLLRDEVRFHFFLTIISYVAIITIRSSHSCSYSINKLITPLIAAAFVAGVNWISSVRAHANHIILSGCSFIIRYLPSINFMRFLLQCQSSSLEMEERKRREINYYFYCHTIQRNKNKSHGEREREIKRCKIKR